jgi:hypothetical protein
VYRQEAPGVAWHEAAAVEVIVEGVQGGGEIVPVGSERAVDRKERR